jgi:hypothetical protein
VERIKNWITIFLILSVFGNIYFINQIKSIYGGDSGDLVSAIISQGVPHPPGYPLFTSIGILFNQMIPVGTNAWRVSFVSSISSLLCLIFLFLTLKLLTKKYFLSFVTTCIFGLTYPVWLYSEVAEVFALNNLFTTLIIFITFLLYKTKKKKYFHLLIYIIALSLSHHHIILFILPAIFYLLTKVKISIYKRDYLYSGIFFFAGLSWYLYFPISVKTIPDYTWLASKSVSDIFWVVSRAGYGSFYSSANISHLPVFRLINVYTGIYFIYQDFRILGLIFIFSGLIYFFKTNRYFLSFILIGVLLQIFFLFYASFPLSDNFYVATFERFVQPIYIFMSILLLGGIIIVTEKFNQFLFKINLKRKIYIYIFYFFLIAYPLGLFTLNYPKISILKNDFSPDYLGEDILNSIPEGQKSILLIMSDTPLFNTLYVYYSQKKWPWIDLIHYSKLQNPRFLTYIKELYSHLKFDKYQGDPQKHLQNFIYANDEYAIYSKFSFNSSQGKWMPYGLIFRYFPSENEISIDKIIEENIKLWSKYRDPLMGSLSKYQNMMISDIKEYYALGHQELGFLAMEYKSYDTAEKHLLASEKLNPLDNDIHNLLVRMYLLQKKCEKAKEFADKKNTIHKNNYDVYLLYSVIYKDCFEDEVKANYFFDIYRNKRAEKETKLEKL